MSISDQSYSETPPTLEIKSVGSLVFLTAVQNRSLNVTPKLSKIEFPSDGLHLKMCFALYMYVEIIELSKLGRLLFAKFRLLVKFRPTWLNLESTLSSVIIIYGYTWS